MADHPALEAIERDAMTETAIMLGREAGLADAVPDGDPWARTCRHHGPDHTRLRRKRSRMSRGVVGLWCEGCDKSSSGLHVPAGWTR